MAPGLAVGVTTEVRLGTGGDAPDGRIRAGADEGAEEGACLEAAAGGVVLVLTEDPAALVVRLTGAADPLLLDGAPVLGALALAVAVALLAVPVPTAVPAGDLDATAVDALRARANADEADVVPSREATFEPAAPEAATGAPGAGACLVSAVFASESTSPALALPLLLLLLSPSSSLEVSTSLVAR